jgi:hypothetical protein
LLNQDLTTSSSPIFSTPSAKTAHSAKRPFPVAMAAISALPKADIAEVGR